MTTAAGVIEHCRTLARMSEEPDGTTRTFLSPPTHDVHRHLRAWMQRLGMETRVDGVGNLRGVYAAGRASARRLILGSHVDTVPGAGAFDGVLGVVLALALIERLNGARLVFEIEVVAFSEEEGVRFGVPFLGSRAVAGSFDPALLQRTDAEDITVAEAIRRFGLDPEHIFEAELAPAAFAYVEFHIEQGPVLESLNLSLGVVDAIAGQTRLNAIFRGAANHAGTTPMHLRRDALAAAAEWITQVEREARSEPGLVATVGRIHAAPNATNVIPGEVHVSLDVRHAEDSTRRRAVAALLDAAHQLTSRRSISFEAQTQLDQPAVAMAPALASALEAAVAGTGHRSHRLISGAGHDAMILAARLPSAMLFLRSPGGVSHHPDEQVREEDVQAALDAGLYFLNHLDASHL